MAFFLDAKLANSFIPHEENILASQSVRENVEECHVRKTEDSEIIQGCALYQANTRQSSPYSSLMV